MSTDELLGYPIIVYYVEKSDLDISTKIPPKGPI